MGQMSMKPVTADQFGNFQPGALDVDGNRIIYQSNYIPISPEQMDSYPPPVPLDYGAGPSQGSMMDYQAVRMRPIGGNDYYTSSGGGGQGSMDSGYGGGYGMSGGQVRVCRLPPQQAPTRGFLDDDSICNGPPMRQQMYRGSSNGQGMQMMGSSAGGQCGYGGGADPRAGLANDIIQVVRQSLQGMAPPNTNGYRTAPGTSGSSSSAIAYATSPAAQVPRTGQQATIVYYDPATGAVTGTTSSTLGGSQLAPQPQPQPMMTSPQYVVLQQAAQPSYNASYGTAGNAPIIAYQQPVLGGARNIQSYRP